MNEPNPLIKRPDYYTFFADGQDRKQQNIEDKIERIQTLPSINFHTKDINNLLLFLSNYCYNK